MTINVLLAKFEVKRVDWLKNCCSYEQLTNLAAHLKIQKKLPGSASISK